MTETCQSHDVLIIGCGAAGIAAATALKDAGLTCMVLEAKPHAGGRAHSSDELGCGVDIAHGAAWLHAYSPEHPMVALAAKAGVDIKRPAWGQSSKTELDILFDGRVLSAQDKAATTAAFRRLSRIIENKRTEISEGGVDDVSWADALVQSVQEATTLDEAVERLLQTEDCDVDDHESESSEENPWSDEENGESENECADMSTDREETKFPDRVAQRAALFVRIASQFENWEGVSLADWSVLHAEGLPSLEGPNVDVVGCYGKLFRRLAEDIDVRFDRTVTSVNYSLFEEAKSPATNRVEVMCKTTDLQHEVYQAKACIVTLPLGVLQQGIVKFDPPLPADVCKAISSLGIARMEKLELMWGERWWPDSVRSILLASDASSATVHPWPWFHEPPGMRSQGKAVLTCYLTQQFALKAVGMGPEQASAKCLSALRHAFPTQDIPDPMAVHLTNWTSDTCTMGSWTYFAAGSSPEHVKLLNQPFGFGGCLMLAGEHTCDGSSSGLDMGSVHGAWLSGKRVAAKIAQEIQRASPGSAGYL